MPQKQQSPATAATGTRAFQNKLTSNLTPPRHHGKGFIGQSTGNACTCTPTQFRPRFKVLSVVTCGGAA